MRNLSDEEVLFPEIIIGKYKIVPWTFNKLFKINHNLKNLSKCLGFIKSLDFNLTLIDLLRLSSFANKDILTIICETLNCTEEEILDLDLYVGLKILTIIYFQNITTLSSGKKKKSKIKITLGDVFTTLISNNIGKSIDDLKNNYTIDQVYMFYEKCKREQLSEQKRNAITLAHALVYTNPKTDKSGARKSQNMWDKYINSLEPKVEKPSSKNIINAFRLLGIPVTKREVNK